MPARPPLILRPSSPHIGVTKITQKCSSTCSMERKTRWNRGCEAITKRVAVFENRRVPTDEKSPQTFLYQLPYVTRFIPGRVDLCRLLGRQLCGNINKHPCQKVAKPPNCRGWPSMRHHIPAVVSAVFISIHSTLQRLMYNFSPLHLIISRLLTTSPLLTIPLLFIWQALISTAYDLLLFVARMVLCL